MSETRVLMIIAPDQFRDEEFFEPYEQFKTAEGWNVTVCSTQTGTAQGMLGQTFDVTELVDDQNSQDYDALVIPGGMGSQTYLWEHSKIRSLVQEFHSQDKVVAAICLSGAVLAKAGILKGRRATVWPTDETKAAFAHAEATYVEEDVVIDGKVITSPGPQAAKDFALTVAEQIKRVAVA